MVIEPRRGARVASIDAARAGDLFELRAPLEGLVAGLAAQRRTAAQLQRLRRIVDAGRTAAVTRDLDALPALNTEFHGALADAAGNELLRSTLARLSDVIRWVYAARISQRSTRSWDEHAAILVAVAAGDVEAARRCGEDHIAAAAAAYQSTEPVEPATSRPSSEAANGAAVDTDRRAGDERGASRAQERHDVGELRRSAQTAEGDRRDVLGADVAG